MSIIKYIQHTLLGLLFLCGGLQQVLAQFPANIGTLPPGKTITICYEVTVDGDTPANTTEVCEQGVVTFDNPNAAGTLTTKTDDPDDPTGDEDETCTEVQVCDITQITAGDRACEDGSTTYSQDITVTFVGGAGNLEIDANGMMYSFPLGVSPQTVTLTGLPIDGNPVDITASFAGAAGCTLTEEDLFTAPTLLTVDAGMDQDICLGESADLDAMANGGTPPYDFEWAPGGQMTAMITVSPDQTTEYTATVTDDIGCVAEDMVTVNVTGISAVVAGDQSECNPWFNTYTQTLEITHTGAPLTGKLSVNGQLFDIEASPQTVVLVDLVADGQPVDVVAFFTDKPECVFEEEDVFTAPQDCSVRCDISDITVGNAHDCDEEAGTYQQDIFLHYQGTNLTGFILVEVDGDNNFTPYPIEYTSLQKITLTLPLDGQEHDIFVKFSDDQGCSFRARRLFRALHMCGCDIVGMELFQEPRCNPDGTYNVCFLVEGFNINPLRGMLQINGQMVDYSSEPVVGGILLCARNIPGNGERGVDVFFKAEDNCTWTARDLYDAPLCDPDACMIEALTVLNATCTDPDPTYDLQLEVTHHNAPNSGTLDIEIGGMTYNFPIDVSPQVVNVFGLPATGAPVTVEARFSDDRDCKLRVEGLYDAPDCGFPCLISDIALAGEPVCDGDGEGATYSVDVVVTYENAPPTGNLRISINGTHTDVPITASPQTVTVEGLVPGGLPTDVTASFTDNANCQRTEPDMFVSPECGIAQPCDIFDIEVFEMTDCDPETNTYDICFEAIGIRLPFDRNDPAFKVIIGGMEYEPGFTDGNGSGTGTLVCVNNIPADGREKDVFIQLTNRCSKYVRRLYTAPMCEPDDEDEDDRCDILSIEATQNYCDGDGTYTQRFKLRYNDAPATGQIALEINGEWRHYNIETSPQTIIVPGLPADGRYVRVFAKFTDVDDCTIYERNLYRAPSDCRSARMAGTQREINIFPNPSNGKFQIMATADSYNTADVKVFNKLGQLVKEIEITENTEAILDLSGQPEGIYTVRIIGDAYVITQKVQVVR